MAAKRSHKTRTRQSGSKGVMNTRNQLLQAGKKLFARKGFDGVSVKELAEDAGVNVSLVSYHFNGKKGLYRACLEEFGQARHNAVARLLQSVNSADELRLSLRLFLQEVISGYVEDPDFCRIVFRDIDFELEREDSALLSVYRGLFVKSFEVLVSFLKMGQKNGVIKRDLDPAISARILYGTAIHMVKTDRLCKMFAGDTIADEKYRKALIDHIISVSLQGIMK